MDQFTSASMMVRVRPTLVNITKRIGINDRLYVAGMGNTQVNLYACSEAQAKQRAVEHFRPKKSQKDLIWVKLA